MSPHIAVLSAASAAFPSTQAGQGTGDGSWAQEAVSHLASVCVCVCGGVQWQGQRDAICTLQMEVEPGQAA